MANDKLDRLVEKITRQQQPGLNGNALEIWKSNLERFAQLKDAIQSAIEGLQKRMAGPDAAAGWGNLAVRFLNSDTMLIEKPESPYIQCTMSLAEDNTSIQGAVRAAKHLPAPDAVVEAPIRIGLTTRSGKPSYSLNGKTFSSVTSLAGELLDIILDTANQDPAVVRAVAAKQSLDAEMKRGVKAIDTVWNRNLKARQKRDARADQKRDARAGRWP
jgi:hypothetical protein